MPKPTTPPDEVQQIAFQYPNGGPSYAATVERHGDCWWFIPGSRKTMIRGRWESVGGNNDLLHFSDFNQPLRAIPGTDPGGWSTLVSAMLFNYLNREVDNAQADNASR